MKKDINARLHDGKKSLTFEIMYMLHSYLYNLIPHPQNGRKRYGKLFFKKKLNFFQMQKLRIEIRSFLPDDFHICADIIIIDAKSMPVNEN